MPPEEVPGVPDRQAIEATARLLQPHLMRTPVWPWTSATLSRALGDKTSVYLKLELLQHAGSFKVRGVLTHLLGMDPEQRSRGVTAVSAGNHAIATAWGARLVGSSAKVVMLRSASPVRVEACQALGAEVVLADGVHRAFDEVHRIERTEGRVFLHPFEGRNVALGTATLGRELCEQVTDLDAVIVPIGGGGLCAGVATACKLYRPGIEVIGVEPEGADSMHRSFAAGSPQSIEAVGTIADSLGAPHAAPYSFALCQQHVDRLVKVTDAQIRDAMRLLFREMKLAVEPAAATATAALLGEGSDRFRGRKVALIVCGSNIDAKTYSALIAPS